MKLISACWKTFKLNETLNQFSDQFKKLTDSDKQELVEAFNKTDPAFLATVGVTLPVTIQ